MEENLSELILNYIRQGYQIQFAPSIGINSHLRIEMLKERHGRFYRIEFTCAYSHMNFKRLKVYLQQMKDKLDKKSRA